MHLLTFFVNIVNIHNIKTLLTYFVSVTVYPTTIWFTGEINVMDIQIGDTYRYFGYLHAYWLGGILIGNMEHVTPCFSKVIHQYGQIITWNVLVHGKPAKYGF